MNTKKKTGCLGRLFAISFGIFLSIFLIEFLFRVAFPIMPYGLQAPLRYVKKTPWSEAPMLPPPAARPIANYQMAVRPDLDHQLEYPNPNVSFHISTKNWLDENSDIGFRVSDVNWQPHWPVDAVVVGDSFSFCFTEYEDCWVNRLETEHGLSMVNLGQGATGSVSHYNILNTFGLPYEPKMVIWQWYGNDFNEDYGFVGKYHDRFGEVSEEPKAETPPNEPILPEGISNWLQANSAVYWLVNIFSGSHRDQAGFAVQKDPYYVTHHEQVMFFGREYSIQTADLTQTKNDIGRDITEQALVDTKKMLDEKGIDLVVLLIPFKEIVYEAITSEQLGDDTIAQLASARLEMVRLCEKHELTCIDPTEMLQDEAKAAELIYFDKDTHLNAKGNHILTDFVWNEIESMVEK